MINLVIDILKANTTLTNLVDANNIYPLIQLQGGTIPSVVVQLTNTDPNDTQDKVSTYDNNSVEVTCMAISPAAAWAISEAARAALDGYTGGLIAQIRFVTQATDIFESTEVFSVTQGYSVHLKRDAGTLPTAIAGLGEFNLDDIGDVDASNPSDDQVLTYDAATGTWAPEDASTVAALDDLTDVTIDDAIDRQVLAYDEATGQWINDGAGSISIPVYNNLNEEIVAGRPLSAVGAQGDRIKVEPYQTSYGTLRFVGIAGENIPARSNGHATVYGEIRGLDTSNFSLGTLLYPLEGVNENFYPFGLFSWVEGTNANPLVCAIVTRQNQNTGRIFVRIWSPGYHDRLNRLDDVVISNPFQGALLRYDSDQGDWRVPPQTSKTILEGATETVEIYYYSITTDTQQFRSAQSDTPSEGNKIVRKIWYSTTAQEDIDSGTWTLLETLADNATYLELVDAFEDQLKTSPGGDTPVSIKTTWAEVEEFTGLLDTYTGAAAAYSLRKLSATYTGAAIRVRRNSDDAEQDIGFDENGDLDTTALATFCSGTDGFVKTWYCQSGNGNDATQTTTGSQPKIYDSVSGVIEEGSAGNEKPAMGNFVDYEGMLFDSVIQATNQFVVCVGYFQINNILIGSSDYFVFARSGDVLIRANGVSETYGTITNGAQMMLSYNRDGVTNELKENGSSLGTSSNLTTQVSDYDGIGNYGRSGAGAFKAQEVIIYNSNQSSNRTGIETNINDHYGIYTPFTTGLLDDYSGAAAAYSLRRLSSTYTGPAIRVRRASDNAEQDIEFDIEGNLNTGALATFCSGTDGFVKVWYDQAGSNDATQTTTGNQPKIYDALTEVELKNSKSAVSFNGSSQFLRSIAKDASLPGQTLVFVAHTNDTVTQQRLWNAPNANVQVFRVNSGEFDFTDYETSPNVISEASISATTDQCLLFCAVNDTDKATKIWRDGTAGTDGTTLTKPLQVLKTAETDIKLATIRDFSGNFWNGTIQEVIFYPFDQDDAGNRTGIETNINDYYSIYAP